MIFELAWTGTHRDTATASGLLPQTVFPAVVGLFTFVIARFGADIQRSLTGFFDFRDRYPGWLRLAVAIIFPIVLSLLISFQERVSQEMAKEQFIVIVSLTVGYLAMAPRTGDFLSAVRQFAPGRK
jgi:hypothetical protein